ncbi:MAG: hypothetical protein AUJ28_03040 [Parcubacteria group bacterium CG1_02_37_51]|uniref:Uncharacterized protein n=2 Tax=Candidatus Komeiliibacteriota TaxID=1817908 RepID=A0A2M8DRW0_9BACT|nr:MAG: hypothetical protein AUJ28_03040 [Parcubacteria group bacterium CG1_02_37_51]PIY95267.1 MAG: hypothetical protein COY67_00870 [Candidatus Komeilibacteria bacterium CG_4_10_14_0_8_um_filter_37_78]PJC02078.1 MAG: hypothetical protein CO073_01350 [Candidatus Komeilibacteria bacterium CG_4_9_14_0_8_um_filter_36_9]
MSDSKIIVGVVILDWIRTYHLEGFRIALNCFADGKTLINLPKSEFERLADHLGVTNIQSTEGSILNSRFCHGRFFTIGNKEVIVVTTDERELKRINKK